MDKKVTSYRLSLDTLKKLEELQLLYNDRFQKKTLESKIPFKKLTKAEIIELLISTVHEEFTEGNNHD